MTVPPAPNPVPAQRPGIYQEYITRNMPVSQLDGERKSQLARIGLILGCEMMTYAARLTTVPAGVPTAVLYEDLLPFHDILGGLRGKQVAVVLETHGGVGEVGRQMVEMLHDQFQHVRFIVPGTAKSTGTIMVLGGHEILMGPASSLGPIDAQLIQDGKQFSADALIEGLDRIKDEVEKSGKLNPAYIPFLQKISPGEIENARNALEFARATVTEWLVTYKFSDWLKDGQPVSESEKRSRAREIAKDLTSQKKWHTHARSIRIPDLRALKLKITDFTDTPDLSDAIQRYHILLRMTFEVGNAFKIYESPYATVARQYAIATPTPAAGIAPPNQTGAVVLGVSCPQCHSQTEVQLDFLPGMPRQAGKLRYPDTGVLGCPHCGNALDLRVQRAELERQLGRVALSPQPTP